MSPTGQTEEFSMKTIKEKQILYYMQGMQLFKSYVVAEKKSLKIRDLRIRKSPKFYNNVFLFVCLTTFGTFIEF